MTYKDAESDASVLGAESVSEEQQELRERKKCFRRLERKTEVRTEEKKRSSHQTLMSV